MHINLRLIIKIIAFATISVALLFPFGKNKVSYNYYEWEVLKTTYFDIYYDEGMKEIAEEAAKIAEEAVNEYNVLFEHEPEKIVPLVLYSSSADFQKTKIMPGFIGEGTGGFTDAYRSRVVIPFTGSYPDFKHVIRHELVHAYQFDVIFGDLAANALAKGFLRMPPLWIVEGMAEYASIGDAGDMYMYVRDGIMTGNLPEIEHLNNPYALGPYYHFVYKGGQSFYNFVEKHFGKDKVAELMHGMKASDNANGIIQTALKMPAEKVNELWMKYLKEEYWTKIKQYDSFRERDKRLTRHFEDKSTFNLHPAFNPAGNLIYLLSNKKVYSRIIAINSATGEYEDKIVTANKDADFEYLHVLDNVISFSEDGRFMCFSAMSDRGDIINVYDIQEDEDYKTFELDFDSIKNPRISQDGKEIVFVGVKRDKADLYIMQIHDASLIRISDDRFIERSPSFSKDGTKVIFSANKNKDGDYYSTDYGIFIYDRISGSNTTAVNFPGSTEESPDLNPDDSAVLFSSDRGGIASLYIKELESGKVHKLTSSYGGAFEPRYSQDGTKIVYAGFEEAGYDVYVMNASLSNETVVKSSFYDSPVLASKARTKQKTSPTPQTKDIEIPLTQGEYESKFKLDMAFFNVGYSSGTGGGGELYLNFTDIMNYHNLFIYAQPLIYEKQFNANGMISYFFTRRRFTFGVNLYHFRTLSYEYSGSGSALESTNYIELWDQSLGANFMLSFPFNKYNRMDLFFNPKYTSTEYISDEYSYKDDSANVYLFELLYVHDSTLWDYYNPRDNNRTLLTAQQSFRIKDDDLLFTMLYADFRQYFLIGRKLTIAARAAAGKVFGDDSDDRMFRMGGISRVYDGAYSDFVTTVRGYENGEFRGDNVLLLNLELRFPLIEYVKFGFLPIALSQIEGILFMDYGSVWNSSDSKWPQLGRKADGGGVEFVDLKSSMGLGVRFIIPPLFFCRIDFSGIYSGNEMEPIPEWDSFFFLGMKLYDF